MSEKTQNTYHIYNSYNIGTLIVADNGAVERLVNTVQCPKHPFEADEELKTEQPGETRGAV